MVRNIDEKEFDKVWTNDEDCEYAGTGHPFTDITITRLKDENAFKLLKKQLLRIEKKIDTELMFYCKKQDGIMQLLFSYKKTNENKKYQFVIANILKKYGRMNYKDLKGKKITSKKFIKQSSIESGFGFGSPAGVGFVCPLF